MGLLVYFADLSTLSIILFVIGLILLVIEMFIPGFGLAGISGIIILVVDIIYSAKTFIQGFWLMIFVLLVLAILFMLFIYLMSHDKLPNRMVLKDETNAKSGFVSSENKKQLLNAEGLTLTALRPAGIANINDLRVDVVSLGGFIESSKKIKVVAVDGGRVVVEEIKEV